MTLVPKSTKSYSIFLEITIDTLIKSLERQGNINSLWLTADTNTFFLHFFFSPCNLNSHEIFSILVFYSPVAQEVHNTFISHNMKQN